MRESAKLRVLIFDLYNCALSCSGGVSFTTPPRRGTDEIQSITWDWNRYYYSSQHLLSQILITRKEQWYQSVCMHHFRTRISTRSNQSIMATVTLPLPSSILPYLLLNAHLGLGANHEIACQLRVRVQCVEQSGNTIVECIIIMECIIQYIRNIKSPYTNVTAIINNNNNKSLTSICPTTQRTSLRSPLLPAIGRIIRRRK